MRLGKCRRELLCFGFLKETVSLCRRILRRCGCMGGGVFGGFGIRKEEVKEMGDLHDKKY